MTSPLRKWRKNAGLGLADLAALLKITPGALSRIERGETRPRDELEARIVKRTGLSRDDLSKARARSKRLATDGAKKKTEEAAA